MVTFFLAEDSPVKAHGLYLYEAEELGEGRLSLTEFVIDQDGQGQKPTQRPPVILSIGSSRAVNWNEGLPPTLIEQTSSLIQVSQIPGTYLSLQPIPADGTFNPDLIITDLLRERPGGDLALPRIFGRHLLAISRNRRENSYRQVLGVAEALPGSELGALRQNARYYWQALSNVSEKIVASLERSFGSDSSSRYTFENPLRMFQLNRLIAEGFINGHGHIAQFELTDLYRDPDVPAEQDPRLAAWRKVLERAEQNKAFEDFINQAENEFLPQEKESLRLLAELYVERIPGPILQLFLGFQRIRRDADAWQVLKKIVFPFTTPGITDREVFYFWYLHYPHWHMDLHHALKTDIEANRVARQDFAAVAKIILESFPTPTLDQESIDRPLNALLIGWDWFVARIASRFFTTVDDVSPFIDLFADSGEDVIVDLFESIQNRN